MVVVVVMVMVGLGSESVHGNMKHVVVVGGGSGARMGGRGVGGMFLIIRSMQSIIYFLFFLFFIFFPFFFSFFFFFVCVCLWGWICLCSWFGLYFVVLVFPEEDPKSSCFHLVTDSSVAAIFFLFCFLFPLCLIGKTSRTEEADTDGCVPVVFLVLFSVPCVSDG